MRASVTLDRTDLASPNLRWCYPLVLIALMWQTARERKELAKLDDSALADLGLTLADARRESRRPFWDLPRRQREVLDRI